MKLRVAKITSPVGLKGESNLYLYTDSPESRFKKGSEFFIGNDFESELNQKVTVENLRRYKNRYIIKLVDFSSREDIEQLHSKTLWIDTDENVLDDDEFYYTSLVGLGVKLSSDSDVNVLEDFSKYDIIGSVKSIMPMPAQDLLEISLSAGKNNGKKTLVPFIRSIVTDVDMENGYLTINPPLGLLDEVY